MKLILSSDFPVTPNARVIEAIEQVAPDPRIAWISAHTDATGSAFSLAQEQFRSLGFGELEHVDIDEDLDQVQVAFLHEFDVIYLGGQDAVRFRYNAMRSGLSGRLRQCAAAGRLIVAASGGALLLTPNVSLLRLQTEHVDDVVATRARFDAIGAVDYELLPHRDRWDAGFLDKVRDYSTRVENDIIALADGAAIFFRHDGGSNIDGASTRYRNGTIITP